MPRSVFLAAAAVCLVAWELAAAAEPQCAAPDCAAPACGFDGATDPCATDACGGGRGCLLGHLVHGCWLHHRGACYEGLEPGFNCGCNGSYKFPVPPLYTYHWPGIYSAQLMTDYRSPWRFPPLKPYSDELPPVATTARRGADNNVRPVSLNLPVATRPAGVMEPMSSKLLR